jgi:hypothetical protein
MADPNLSDKAPLDLYLQAIANDVLAAVEQVEAAHPAWQVTSLDVTVRCALRPELAPDGKTVLRIWGDMDTARSEQVTEITLPLRWK